MAEYNFKLFLTPEVLRKFGNESIFEVNPLGFPVKNQEKVLTQYPYIYNSQIDPDPYTISRKFIQLLNQYSIKNNRSDFFYYVLNIHYDAQSSLSTAIEGSREKSQPKEYSYFVKDLAGLMLLYKTEPNDNQLNIRVGKGLHNGVTFESNILTSWIHGLIKSAILTKNFPLTNLEYFTGLLPENDFNELSLSDLKLAAESNIRAISIDRTRSVGYFCSKIHEFMIEHNVIPFRPSVKYPTKNMRFLIQLAMIFNWLPNVAVDKKQLDAMSKRVHRYATHGSD